MKQIKKQLKELISEKRYRHSKLVMKAAEKLAEIYNVDIERAKLAGLLHDCGKNLSIEEMLEYAEKEGFKIGEEYVLPEMLHGIAGAVIARENFEINDEEILNAIRFHTIGKRNMSIFEKIIYIADVIEEDRICPNIDEIRKLAFENLDLAIIREVENKIERLVLQGRIIHINTIEMRNRILMKLKKEQEY